MQRAHRYHSARPVSQYAPGMLLVHTGRGRHKGRDASSLPAGVSRGVLWAARKSCQSRMSGLPNLICTPQSLSVHGQSTASDQRKTNCKLKNGKSASQTNCMSSTHRLPSPATCIMMLLRSWNRISVSKGIYLHSWHNFVTLTADAVCDVLLPAKMVHAVVKQRNMQGRGKQYLRAATDGCQAEAEHTKGACHLKDLWVATTKERVVCNGGQRVTGILAQPWCTLNLPWWRLMDRTAKGSGGGGRGTGRGGGRGGETSRCC